MRSLVVVGLTVSLLAVPATAQKTLSDGIKDLAVQISSSTTKEQKQRVAVLAFQELDGKTTVLGTYLAEELLSHLVNSGLKVVERGMLDKLLGELKLQQTGAIDPSTAKQVGKVAGVDAIITGTVTDLQSIVGINCRLIDTSTGEIFAAAQTKITKDDDVKKIMAITVTPHRETRSDATPSRQPPKWVFQWGDMKLVVDSISRSGNIINITFAAENGGSSEQRFHLGAYKLVDENGETWSGQTSEGNSSHYMEVAPGTRRRVRWRFAPDGDPTGTTFSLVLRDGANLLMSGLRPNQ